MIWNGGTSSWTWITWCRPTWSRRGSDSGCEVRSRAHAGRSSRRPVWLCRRRFNRSNRRLPAGILRLVPRRLCDCATHGSVRRCYCILSKTSLSIPPKYSVAHTIGFLKGKSAVRIHRELLQERRMTGLHFWATGYCVSTVGLDESRVRQYIREQDELDRRQGELNLE